MSTPTTGDRIALNEMLDALWELESWAHQALRGEGSNDAEDVAEGKRLVDELVKKAKRHREAHHERA